MASGKLKDIPGHAAHHECSPFVWHSGLGQFGLSIVSFTHEKLTRLFCDGAHPNTLFDDCCTLKKDKLCTVNSHAVRDYGKLSCYPFTAFFTLVRLANHKIQDRRAVFFLVRRSKITL
jgi:hypothetical protein